MHQQFRSSVGSTILHHKFLSSTRLSSLHHRSFSSSSSSSSSPSQAQHVHYDTTSSYLRPIYPPAPTATSSHLSSSQSPEAALAETKSLLSSSSRILVLTGAGISTESSVPDYRSPGRPPHRPTSHQQFLKSFQARQRYWARSLAGYTRMVLAKPNLGHTAIARGQNLYNKVLGVITQNVDPLHERAGSKNVLHLHGTLDSVKCMSCGHTTPRDIFQER